MPIWRVLIYIGDLSPIIKLLKNKKIIFSVEVSNEVVDYSIQTNGRYRYNSDYVEKLLIENGFSDIAKESFIIRTENGKPVRGIIFKGI